MSIRELGLRINDLLLRLFQVTRSLPCGSLGGSYSLGRSIGCSSLCGLKRRLGITGCPLGSSQGFILVRQLLLGSIERSLSVLKRLDILIGLVLRSAQLLFQLGRSSGGRAIARTAGRVIGAPRLLLVDGGSIVGSGSRFQTALAVAALARAASTAACRSATFCAADTAPAPVPAAAVLVSGDITAAVAPVAPTPSASCATATRGDSIEPPVMAIVAAATVTTRPAALALPKALPSMSLFIFLLIVDSFPR